MKNHTILNLFFGLIYIFVLLILNILELAFFFIKDKIKAVLRLLLLFAIHLFTLTFIWVSIIYFISYIKYLHTGQTVFKYLVIEFEFTPTAKG